MMKTHDFAFFFVLFAGLVVCGPSLVSAQDTIWIGTDYTGEAGDIIDIEIMLTNPLTAVNAFSMDLSYDPDMLQYQFCLPGNLDPGWAVFDCYQLEPGEIAIDGFALPPSEIPAGSDGVLATVTFLVTCDDCGNGDSCDLIPHEFLDNIIDFIAVNGLFTFGSACVNNGDVNLDGEITAGDAQLAFSIVLGTYSPTFEEECAADCNGDGEVTASDAQAIFLVVLGISDCADPLS
jgi:hypothetical protein